MRMDFREMGWRIVDWFRVGFSVGLLWTCYCTFRFYERWGISWWTEWLASWEGLCSVDLISCIIVVSLQFFFFFYKCILVSSGSIVSKLCRTSQTFHCFCSVGLSEREIGEDID
jgi:hypothetical protein